MGYMESYKAWCANEYFDEATRAELKSIEGNEKEIEDRFYKDLEFGTGGLRGVIGNGTNRMNIYTVRKATQGLANFIKKENAADRGVAIAYDSRRMSPEFADEAALCLNANGIKAYIFPSLRPTPELSFAVRQLHCIAGIVITASHNPPEYNGYKVYWEDGAQITAPKDTQIITEVKAVTDYNTVKTMEKDEAEACGLYNVIGYDMDEAYIKALKKMSITGYPRATEQEEWEKLGYEDHIMVTGEPFALWVIESAKDISKEFPLPDAGLPVIFTDNQKPYKQRKVRILNGAHTSFVLASYLCGNDIVRQSMQDDDIRNFMLKTIYDEVIPTLSLPEEELKQFAGEVVNRFNNPYVDHALLAISLNSVSKWRARCMPSLLGYVEKTGKLPAHLTFSIAALMAFYTGTEIRDKALIGHRDGQEYNIMDDKAVLEFFAANCEKDTKTFVTSFLGNEDFFGQDLNKVPGLTDAVVAYLDDIKANGMRAALCKIS